MTQRTAKQKALDAAAREGLGDSFDQFEYFFTTYQKQIFAGAGILVLAVAAIAGIYTWNVSQNRAAANAFAEAKTVPQLETALKNYGNNDLAYGARRKLAQLQAETGKFEVAVTVLEPIAGTGEIKLQQGTYRENAKQFPAALALYTQAAQMAGSPVAVQAEANYQAGRLALKLGKTPEAKLRLERVGALARESAAAAEWARQAEFLLRGLPGAPKAK